MPRALLILLLTLVTATTVRGQSYYVSRGQLAKERVLPANASTITINGSVDASDLDYMTEAIESLGTLNLSGVTVVAYRGKRVGANITASAANTLPAGIFAGLKASHIILPASLTVIGDGAFMESQLVDIALPARVKTVGRAALSRCPNLREVTIPASVTALPDALLEGCEALTDISLPAGLQTIGSRAMLGCTSLTGISVPASVTSIGDEAFALSGLDAIDLSKCSGLRTIGNRAFSTCTHLESATLPSSATKLGEGIFFECQALTAVKLPSEAVTIPPLTLKGADNLSAIDLPENVETIGTLAMAGMNSVEAVTLPGTLTHISDGAFEGWTSLSEVHANDLTTVPTLGEDIWGGVDQSRATLYVPEEMENTFVSTPQWQEFAISQSSITRLPELDSESRITAGFEGTTLVVTTTEPLQSVTLYSLDGRTLARIADSGTETVRIDTSAHSGHFFIARAVTATDRRAVTFKLMREP